MSFFCSATSWAFESGAPQWPTAASAVVSRSEAAAISVLPGFRRLPYHEIFVTKWVPVVILSERKITALFYSPRWAFSTNSVGSSHNPTLFILTSYLLIFKVKWSLYLHHGQQFCLEVHQFISFQHSFINYLCCWWETRHALSFVCHLYKVYFSANTHQCVLMAVCDNGFFRFATALSEVSLEV